MSADSVYRVIEKSGRAITVLLLLVGALGVRSWVVTPHLASLKASQQYKRVTDDRIEKSKAVNNQLQAKRTGLKKLAAEYASLSSMAFSSAGAEAFFNGLGTFCEESECVVASLRFVNGPDQTLEPGDMAVVAQAAVLTVHGHYSGVAALIAKLQARREKVWIDALQIGRLVSDSSRVACTITITIYVNLDEESIGYEQGPIQQ